jgi:hypothetical protein
VCSANKGEVSINSTSVVLVTTLPNWMLFSEFGSPPEDDKIAFSFIKI